MWLPKDERKLLAFYYTKARKTGQNLRFEQHVELMKVLGFNENIESEPNNEKFDMVLIANDKLKDNGFINIRYDTPGLIAIVTLTSEGQYLGRKYSLRFGIGTFCLWCKEYKVILTIIGLILTLLIVIFAGISAFKNK